MTAIMKYHECIVFHADTPDSGHKEDRDPHKPRRLFRRSSIIAIETGGTAQRHRVPHRRNSVASLFLPCLSEMRIAQRCKELHIHARDPRHTVKVQKYVCRDCSYSFEARLPGYGYRKHFPDDPGDKNARSRVISSPRKAAKMHGIFLGISV